MSELLNVAEIFGEDVFNDKVMQERLPKKVYKDLKKTIEEGKELYIGVPGVCHAREMQAAKAFGFTKFITVSETGVSLNDEERNPGEDFGYYCRRIIRNE